MTSNTSRSAVEHPWDLERPLGALAKIFKVSKWRLLEQQRRGLVKFRKDWRGEFSAWFGRPSQVLSLPLYCVKEVADFCGVCTKTVWRDFRKGKIRMKVPPRREHYRVTPRDLASYKRRREASSRSAKIPNLFDLMDRLS